MTTKPTWKTVRLGVYSSILDLTYNLQAVMPYGYGGFYPDYEACSRGGHFDKAEGKFIQEIVLAPKPIEVNLVRVTLDELGLPYLNRYDAEMRAKERFGLEKCPLEVGMQLRLQWPDQSAGDAVTVISDYFHGSVWARFLLLNLSNIGGHRLSFIQEKESEKSDLIFLQGNAVTP